MEMLHQIALNTSSTQKERARMEFFSLFTLFFYAETVKLVHDFLAFIAAREYNLVYLSVPAFNGSENERRFS